MRKKKLSWLSITTGHGHRVVLIRDRSKVVNGHWEALQRLRKQL